MKKAFEGGTLEGLVTRRVEELLGRVALLTRDREAGSDAGRRVRGHGRALVAPAASWEHSDHHQPRPERIAAAFKIVNMES